MTARCGILPFLLLCSIAARPQAQQPNEPKSVPVFKAKSRLVLVDVVVTGSKGEPVTGLKKEDFEVLEDGKPQFISTFEEHKGAPPREIKLPPMPANVYTNFPVVQSADSLNVLLLDALNTPTSDQAYVHSQMIQHLKEIPANTRIAVFTLASRLRMLQGVTTDSAAVLAAINKAGTHQSALLQSDVEAQAYQRYGDFMMENAAGPPSPNQSLAQASVDALNSATMFLNDTKTFLAESRTAATLQALQQLARYLSIVPGRKNVMWFSGSFPAGILPDPDLVDPFGGERNFMGEIRKTADLMTTAQVALYPIGAEGLATDPAFQSNGMEIGEKRGSVAMQDQIENSRNASWDRDASHAAMEQLAKETGGQAFYNVNALGEVLQRAIKNGAHYYSLAYSPTSAAADGKYHYIGVKVKSGKFNLAYRRGYFADDLASTLGSSEKKQENPLMALMGRNLPEYTQILYKVLVQPTKPQPSPDAPRAGSNTEMKGPVTRYGVDFAVSLDDLRIDVGSDGARHGNIEVMLVAYDSEGKPLNLLVSRSEIRIPEKDFAGVRNGGLQIHKEIDVPPGEVYLRTGIYDLKSASAGTLGISLSRVRVTAAK